MSMIGCFCAIRDEDLLAIVKKPDLIHVLWEDPPGFKDVTTFDVDKAWQGIHFLLTGSDWEGEGPLAFILHGGAEIDEDLGYGPPHFFTSSEVKKINAALHDADPDALYEKTDPQALAEHDIYPDIWKREPKESSIGYLRDHLLELKKFIAEVAATNRALLVYLG